MTDHATLLGETLPAALQAQRCFTLDSLLAPLTEAVRADALDRGAVRAALLAALPRYAELMQDQPFKMTVLCILPLRELWQLVSPPESVGNGETAASWFVPAGAGRDGEMAGAAWLALLRAPL